MKHLGIRMHNEMAARMNLAGHKAKYIDPEAERLKESDPHDDDTIEKLDKSTNDYLATVRQKYG